MMEAIKHKAKEAFERWAFLIIAAAIVFAATATALFASGPIQEGARNEVPIELKGVGITENLGGQVDLNLMFRNEKGELVPLRSVIDGKKPVALLLAYYGCPNLCNLFLNGATKALKQNQWLPGKEYQVLTVSFDPAEEPELAANKKKAHLEELAREGAANGWHFWVNDKTADTEAQGTNVMKLASQVGFRYKWDKDQNQFAHSSAIVFLTPAGKISRYLYGIDFREQDFKLALVEAGERKIGSFMDHVMLFCYSYDPKSKKYSLYAKNLMRAGGGMTVLLVSGVLAGVYRRNRRRPLA